MEQNTERRKLRNTFVEPGAQFRLSIPFLIPFTLSTFLLAATHWEVAHAINDLELTAQSDTLALGRMQELSESILKLSLGGSLILALLTVGFWLLYSHRIFGPIVPILRKLKELEDDQDTEPISLRKFDEMKPIAESINRIAKKWRERN